MHLLHLGVPKKQEGSTIIPTCVPVNAFIAAGSGLKTTDFDLLEIQDDVVFGSRSAYIMAGESHEVAECRSYFFLHLVTGTAARASRKESVASYRKLLPPLV